MNTPKESTPQSDKRGQDLEVGVDNMGVILQEHDKKPSSRLNYSPSEDLCLCKLYVSASCDPTHGTCEIHSLPFK